MECSGGFYLDIDLNQKTSICRTCPANTFSNPGLVIEGNMGDWKDLMTEISKGEDEETPISFHCFSQDESGFW
jgi:hypothetical protein